MRRLHCLTWSSSSSWNYGLRRKKKHVFWLVFSIISIRRTPLIGTALPQLYLLFSERYFAAQLSGRRACQCPAHRPKCQQIEPILLSIPKAMVHKISFDFISGTAGASKIHLDIFCPWEDMIKPAATFATLLCPTTSQRKVNWGPLKDPSSQTEMEQTWKLWWWVLHKIKSESGVSFGHCSPWVFSPPQIWKATSQGQVLVLLVVHEKCFLLSTMTISISYFTRV